MDEMRGEEGKGTMGRLEGEKNKKARELQICSCAVQEVSNNPVRLTPMLPWLQSHRSARPPPHN